MWYIHTHSGILFHNKKEWSADTCYNMDEPWTCYAKCKKPGIKGHIAWFYFYEMFATDKSTDRKEIREDRNREWLLMGMVSFWSDVLELDSSDGCKTL